MTPLVRRVVAGLGANAFGQAINVGIQLISLPLFLHRWDLATYGTWLVLSAIPSYLSMADVGMVTVAGNEMTMAMGRGDVDRANSLFQSILALMTIVCGALAVLAVPVFLLLPLPGIGALDQRYALLALALGVLTSFYGGLADIVFRSTHRFATGVMLGNLGRLLEWAGGILGLLFVGNFTAVALGALGARVAATAASIALSRRDQGRDIRWGFGNAHREGIRRMVRPALSFMAFPLANALTFQGITLLVANLFGPVLVAVFNAYRTMARVATQLTYIFGSSLWPEFSRLYGSGGPSAVASVYRRAMLLGTWIAVGLSVALYPLTPLFLRIWTHGKIEFEPVLAGILLAYASAAGLLHVPRVLLISTNLHFGIAQWTLVSSFAALLLSYLFGPVLGIRGVALAMLATEGVLALACLVLARRILGGEARLPQASLRESPFVGVPPSTRVNESTRIGEMHEANT